MCVCVCEGVGGWVVQNGWWLVGVVMGVFSLVFVDAAFLPGLSVFMVHVFSGEREKPSSFGTEQESQGR